MNQTQEIRTAAIIGAGPAGSSLAIRLANMGVAVTLIERERFPRDKLCGEFISPECRTHFAELGIEDRIATYGGREIGETRFTAINGRTVMVPSEWFGSNNALSLSRAAMDEVMLRRAYELGVETLEGWSATRAEILNGRIDSLMIRSQTGETRTLSADIFIDAAGRSGILERLCDSGRTKGARAEIVAFKAHFSGIASLAGRCEIFSFPEANHARHSRGAKGELPGGGAWAHYFCGRHTGPIRLRHSLPFGMHGFRTHHTHIRRQSHGPHTARSARAYGDLPVMPSLQGVGCAQRKCGLRRFPSVLRATQRGRDTLQRFRVLGLQSRQLLPPGVLGDPRSPWNFPRWILHEHQWHCPCGRNRPRKRYGCTNRRH
ncbi:tryptophan 7-halogenase [Leptolyngbya sp. 7M]|nr:FAD-dependent monooxygenase [Leptolyngbya sp. 7M]QYO64763.1 tryptophan 7-halogenase [Leptolyngbya sp. 7M]